MRTMGMYEAVYRQLHDAYETGYKRIVHIRVTTDAIPGSMAAVPITPERARVLGALVAIEDAVVVADPQWYECALELVIHPEDWRDLLRETPKGPTIGLLEVGKPTRVFGLPVSR